MEGAGGQWKVLLNGEGRWWAAKGARGAGREDDTHLVDGVPGGTKLRICPKSYEGNDADVPISQNHSHVSSRFQGVLV